MLSGLKNALRIFSYHSYKWTVFPLEKTKDCFLDDPALAAIVSPERIRQLLHIGLFYFSLNPQNKIIDNNILM